MNEQLRKRLEEAADIYAKRIWNNLLEVHISKTDFLAGAELGYKKAIEVAKEWLDYKVGGYLGLIREEGIIASTFRTAQMLIDFEADMLKLLEDRK